jgi:F-type H+-transporting ATPase subunit gamma
VESLGEYKRTLDLGFQVLLKHKPEGVRLSLPVGFGPIGMVIMGSQQGLAGRFNAEIVSFAMSKLERLRVQSRGLHGLALGDLVKGTRRPDGIEVDHTLSIPSTLDGINDMVQEAPGRIDRWHDALDINLVMFFHHQHLHGPTYEPVMNHLLPLDTEWLDRLQSRKWDSRAIPQFTVEWRELLSALIREHFFLSLYRGAAESLASENASRLASMQAAEKNIEEELDNLTKQYHHLRQDSITAELMDIVGGFEAIREE